MPANGLKKDITAIVSLKHKNKHLYINRNCKLQESSS